MLGNEALMKEHGIDHAAETGMGTVIYLALDGKYAGFLRIADTLRENTAKALHALRGIGINDFLLLTGDSKASADVVAKELGINRVHSQLLPQDKLDIIEKALEEKREGLFAFVGDGINDAPVLSRVDVGIAMGALGSDAAIEAADVVLMDDDPAKIAEAISVSRRCMRIVRQNISFAIGVKLICLVLSALGITGMWLAIFADVGVMVLAVLNAMRAMYTGGKL